MSWKDTKTPVKSELTGKARYQLPMRKGKRNADEYYFTPELEERFRKLYPTTPNRDMMRMFGICFSTLQRFKRIMSLEKNMKIIRHKQAQATKKTCEENGYYDSLRGKAPSPQCLEGFQRKLASGWHSWRNLKEKNPRRFKKLIEERRKRRIELERKERFRIKVGLEQHTKLHRPAIIFDRRQTCYRCNMKRHGYILGDMADNSGERYTIFYDELTERHPKAEANAGTYGFRIVSLIKRETS